MRKRSPFAARSRFIRGSIPGLCALFRCSECFDTVWCVRAIGDGGLLFRELAEGSIVSNATSSIFVAIIVVVAGILLVYGCRTVVQV